MTSHPTGTDRIETLGELAALYREPSAVVKGKTSDRIGPVTQAVLEQSPFCLLATADDHGRCDVSPRGGAPGQVRVLDERHVALPDLGGNNLIDSLRNIVANGHAGLLVLTPGIDETLRIDGPAHLTTDPDILHLWDEEVRTPKLAVVIEISSAFMHCAKAFRRSSFWQPESWPSAAADPGEMFIEQSGNEGLISPTEMRELLEASYEADLAEERPT